MDLYTIVGLGGVIAYVAAYALLQLDILDGNSVTYSLANVVGASLVLISLTADFNLASALIQITWIAIGVAGLVLRFRRSLAATTLELVPDQAPTQVAS